MLKYILMDIEGTTTSIEFVHKVLFPYSNKKLGSFLNDHWDECREEIETLERNVGKKLDINSASEILKDFIAKDVKDGSLKSIQGKIWKFGYESGEIKGHVYQEVKETFQAWTKKGLKLGIYSSGSVLAQKLIFGFSEQGDLTTYLSNHFDTKIGHKRDAQSYKNIIKELNLAPEQILFLSDMAPECHAAIQAGMKSAQLIRDDKTEVDDSLKGYNNFTQIII